MPQLLVSIGVDAAMQRMQAAKPDPRVDGAAPQAKRSELPPGDHPMLARREFPKPPFPLRVRLTMHANVKLTRNRSLPHVAANWGRC